MASKPRADRLTLDYDAYVPSMALRAIRGYHGLLRDADAVDVYVSTSHRGIHLVGWFDELLDDETRERIRRNLGDDTRRVNLDTDRGRVGHTTDVTWTRKAKNGSQERHQFTDVYDALTFIEQRSL